MFNVPLEAWNNKGISALASSVGIPLIMDSIIAEMRLKVNGRVGYARILVEVNAKNGFKDKIEIQYKDAQQNVVRTKYVKVEYSWKPQLYDHCFVFGHGCDKCMKRSQNDDEVYESINKGDDNGKRRVKQNTMDKEGFTKVTYKWNGNYKSENNKHNTIKQKFKFRPKVNRMNEKEKDKGRNDENKVCDQDSKIEKRGKQS
ncbi:ankyrin repeat-containing protein [Tanacetum coccineum]